MNVVFIGVCCLMDLLFVRTKVAKSKQYVRIGCEQNMKLWTIHSVCGLLGLMIYLAFFPGGFVWKQGYVSKFMYIGVLFVFLILIEFISPSRQLLFFFRKAPDKEQEQLHEIEESYDRLYQFFSKIMQVLMVSIGVLKGALYVLAKVKSMVSLEDYVDMSDCMVYAVGVFLLLFSCVSFRQTITQLCLTKKGYFRQDIFQTLRKKDEIQDRLRATHRKL